MTSALPGAPSAAPLRDVIGEGAHSVVYRDVRRGRTVAVKVSRKLASEDGTAQRLRAEASSLARVRHPGLVAAYETGVRSDGHAFVVLEYVEGETLAQRLKRGPLTEQEATALGLELAGALAAVHAAGLLHRDVKPANVLLPADGGRAKLIDFGLVADRRAEGARAEAVGTFLYAAPEQTGMLKLPVDGRADLYALGVLLYEAVAGAPPLTAPDAGELIRKHAVEVPPGVRARAPHISEAFEAVLARLLAKDPDDRYPHAQALATDLERHRAGELDPETLSTRAALRPDGAALVEREHAMGKLVSRLESARQRRGSLVSVEGPLGMGKTHLLRAFEQRARALGGLCLWAKAGANPSPLALFKQLVQELMADVSGRPASEAAALRLRVREAAGEYAPYLAELFPDFRPLYGGADDPDLLRAGHEIHYDALARLFTHVGTADEPCVLFVEDVDAFDDASLVALRKLVSQNRRSALLIVCTRRAEAEQGPLSEVLGADPKLALTLEPLSPAGVSKLASTLLGTRELDTELVQQLVVRCHGNPLAVSEHVRAMLERGVLLPDWGRWRLQREALASLVLPGDVQELLLTRIAALGGESLRVLSHAALLGDRFDAHTLTRVAETEPAAVQRALADGLDAGVIELLPDGCHGFLQDAARQHLAEALDDAARRRLHRVAAEVLAARAEQDPDALYAAARHHAESADPETAAAACAINAAAGRHALAQQAPREALGFLCRARELAARYELTAPAGMYLSLADAFDAAGDVDGCLEVTPLAVEDCPDRYERVRVLKRAAELHVMNRMELERAEALLRRGYELLGMGMPRNSPWLLLNIPIDAARCAWQELWFSRRRRRQTGKSDRERRYQSLAQLQEITNRWAIYSGRLFILLGTLFRVFLYGLKAGPSREQVWAFATHEITLTFFRRSELRGLRYHQLAKQLAEELGDRVALARVHALHGMVLTMRGHMVEGAAWLEKSVRKHVPWMDSGDVLLTYGQLAMNYAARGYTAKAVTCLRACLRDVEHSAEAHNAEARAHAVQADVLEAAYTQPALAVERAVRAIQESGGPERVVPWLNAWSHRIVGLIETDDLGALDAAIQEAERCGATVASAGLQAADYWVSRARARMAQALQAPVEERAQRLAQLREAAKAVPMAAALPPVAALVLVCEAACAHLEGKRDEALAALTRAEQLGAEADAPEVSYQVFALRARILRDQGREEMAVRYLAAAKQVAGELGWTTRERRMSQLLSTCVSYAQSSSDAHGALTATRTVANGASAESHKLRRDRDALLDVSLAAAQVFDPAEQAKVALDRLTKILSAERAFLFLWDAEEQRLALLAGRHTSGRDLPAERLPWSLIEKVRETRAPMVVSGTEEGARLGFQSVVTHEIRSMICAPLMLRERFTGVVYLDSTLAKGVFTESDLDILRAIANQIAISQETAKSAQREIERRALERDLELTGAVQTLLLPRQDTWIEGELRVCAHYQPVSRAGGDYWFATFLEDGTLRVLIADVTGHGAGASMVTAAVAGCQRALSDGHGAPNARELLGTVHRVLKEVCRGAYTMPACLLEVHPGGRCEAWSAAAPPALVQRADGQVEAHGAPGHPLGGDELVLGHRQWSLAPGERVLGFTDGIVELELPSGRELGLRRIKEILRECRGLDLQQSRARIMERVQRAQGGVPTEDDITYVLIERAAQPRA